MTEDKQSLIVITAKYHYIFEVQPILLNTLKSSFAKRATTEFHHFYVSEFGDITGEVWVHLNTNAADVDKQEAIKAGYLHDDKDMPIQTTIKMHGHRYKSNAIKPKAPSIMLSKTYKIPIQVVIPSADTAQKILESPLAIADDGLLLLGLTAVTVIDFGFDVLAQIFKD